MWVRTKNVWIFAEGGFQKTLVHTSNANPWFWRVRNVKEKVKEDLLAEGKHLEKRQDSIQYDMKLSGVHKRTGHFSLALCNHIIFNKKKLHKA